MNSLWAKFIDSSDEIGYWKPNFFQHVIHTKLVTIILDKTFRQQEEIYTAFEERSDYAYDMVESEDTNAIMLYHLDKALVGRNGWSSWR